MRLRDRVMGFGALAMLVVGIALFVLARGLVLSAAERTEVSEMKHEVSHVSAAVDARLSGLSDVTARWASSGVGPDAIVPGYLWSAPSGSDAQVDIRDCDLLILYAEDGSLLRVTGRFAGSDQVLPTTSVESVVQDYPRLNMATQKAMTASGLVRLSDGRVALAAARRVRAADVGNRSASTLIALRVADEAFAHEVSRLTGLDTTLDSTVEDEVATRSPRVQVASAEQLTGYLTLFDVEGTPVALARMTSGRSVSAASGQLLGLIASGLFVMIALAALCIGVLVDRLVLRRLASLGSQVDCVASGEMPQQVAVEGNDEISALARHIDTMVSGLAASRDEISRAHSALEGRVEDRTEELRAAVANLRAEIEERERTEEALFESERRFRGLVDSLFDSVITLDEHGTVLFANAAVERMFGRTPGSVVGSALRDLFDPDSARVLGQRLSRGLTAPMSDFDLKVRTADGALHDVEITLMPIRGSLGVAQAILRDVTLRRRYENELMHMASHDFLTGLCNRRRFEEEVERAVAQSLRREAPGAILWFDLDYFKEVNDTLGHRVGDQLLVKVARALSKTVRSESILARLGGDEFALLLYQADAVEARHAAERVLSEIKDLAFEVDGTPVHVSASVGVVLFPEHGVEVEELLTRADVAMYRAKETGRSRWVIYATNEDWRDDMRRRRTWADRIQRALDHGGFVAYAQPVVNVGDSSVRSFELLVRMRDEDGDLIAPERFLGAAERVGLVRDIDLWMVREAVALLAEYRGEDLRLEVNLSSRTFHDPSFFIEVGELLHRAEVDPARLGIEISESAVMGDVAGVEDSVRILKQIGCRLSLDDFGAGFASFYRLKQLPLDDLKIDGDFVDRLKESPADQHLVRAIVEMARGLGMLTTAEYVQSDDTMDLLKQFGVDHAQGFGLAVPGPAADVIANALRPSAERTAGVDVAS